MLLSEFFNLEIHLLYPIINHFESHALLSAFQNTGSCGAEAMFIYTIKSQAEWNNNDFSWLVKQL